MGRSSSAIFTHSLKALKSVTGNPSRACRVGVPVIAACVHAALLGLWAYVQRVEGEGRVNLTWRWIVNHSSGCAAVC